MIPKHMQPSLDRWVEHGLPHPDEMGRFLFAVLTNDLKHAVMYADDINRAAIVEWARHIYNDLPAMSHGSRAALLAWHELGGHAGYERAKADRASEDPCETR